METVLLKWVGLQLLGSLLVWLIVSSQPTWARRKQLTAIVLFIVMISAVSSGLFGILWATVVIVLGHIFMMMNLLRVYHADSPEKRLRSVLLVEHVSISLFTICVLICAVLFEDFFNAAGSSLVLVLATIGSFITLASVFVGLYRTKRLPQVHRPSAKLPTVTVAIAARNEVHAIKSSLDQLLACSYPKMEILVLDDCSQDGTSQIIRSFAHKGVRFIEGKVPSPSWQPRNQAFARLAEEASGDFIVFMGVDVHTAPKTIQDVIETMLSHGLDMASAIPARRKADFWPTTLLLPRNFFQLAFPRTIASPAVLSSFWVIKKSTLRNLGGFSAVRSAIMPEEFFARALSLQKKYRLLRGNSYGITTRKRVGSQVETEIRHLYPQLHRRLSMAYLSILFGFSLYLSPFLGLFYLGTDNNQLGVLAFVAASVFIVASSIVNSITLPLYWPRLIATAPLMMLVELGLIAVSAYKYEFSEVLWKGRSACVPLQLETIPRLPQIGVELPKAKE